MNKTYKTSEEKRTSASWFRFDLVPEETLTLNMKYRETLHSFLRGKSLNSHRSSSDSSQVLLVGWIQFLQKCRCELEKKRVSMQNVWCLVLEMSSGSQSLSLPWFPAPSGPAGAMPWVWYNYAFFRGCLFICGALEYSGWTHEYQIMLLGEGAGKDPHEFLIHLKYLMRLYLHELEYSSFEEDNICSIFITVLDNITFSRSIITKKT